MKISIITPAFNCDSVLKATVHSIIDQSYSNWELIIVDDLSTDSTLEVAQQFADSDDRIKVLKLEKNSGAAVARNTALINATGRYIAFLDSDDLWKPHKLETQLRFMQENDIAFSYSAYAQIDETGEFIREILVPATVSYSQLLKTNVIGCLTAMYDVEKLGKVKMPLIRKRQDFGLWLNILKKTDLAYGIQEPLALYRVRENSVSANKFSAASYTWRLYRDVERLSLLSSVYCFTCYAVGGVLRSRFPKIARALGFVC